MFSTFATCYKQGTSYFFKKINIQNSRCHLQNFKKVKVYTKRKKKKTTLAVQTKQEPQLAHFQTVRACFKIYSTRAMKHASESKNHTNSKAVTPHKMLLWPVIVLCQVANVCLQMLVATIRREFARQINAHIITTTKDSHISLSLPRMSATHYCTFYKQYDFSLCGHKD